MNWVWLIALLGIIALAVGIAYWDMAIAEYALKLFQTLLSWPVVIGLLVIYFLRLFRLEIARLIDRTESFAFPGGKLTASEYPGEADRGMNRSKPTQATAELKTKDDLAEDFSVLIVAGVTSNQAIIANLIDRILAKPPFSMFGFRKPPERYLDKVQALQQLVPKEAIADLTEVEEFLRGAKKLERSEQVRVYITSQKLVWYLTDLALRR